MLDDRSIIGFFVAKAHAILFHDFFRSNESFDIAEQAADCEGMAHIPSAVGAGNNTDYICIPHLFMVLHEKFPRNTNRIHEFFGEIPAVMRNMEDRITGYNPEIQFRNPEKLLCGIEPDPAGHHGRADKGLDRVVVCLELEVEIKRSCVIRMDFRHPFQAFVKLKTALLFQNPNDFRSFFRCLKTDTHVAIFPEVVFHLRFLLDGL